MDENISIVPPGKNAIDKRWSWPGDNEDCLKMGERCSRIWCKHCGIAGWSVKHSGDIYDDELGV